MALKKKSVKTGIKTEWKYKGYNIFLESYKPLKYRIISYAKDFKPKVVNSLKNAKKFIDKVLGVE